MSVAVITVRGVEVPVEFDILLVVSPYTRYLTEEVEWFPVDQEAFDAQFGSLTLAEQEDVEEQILAIQAERDEAERDEADAYSDA